MAKPIFSIDGKTVWIAGHTGLVGSALLRHLESRPVNVLTVDRSKVDLRRQEAVESWMTRQRPQIVIVAAATVGGIAANARFPAKFLYDNLEIASNIINAAHQVKVEKLLFLGSTCIYPKLADQPINEDSLLTGPLEPTNQWYAIAKIAGVKLVEAFRQEYGCDFISAMPTNLYGPNDNFDPQTSHVLAALLQRIHLAKVNEFSTVEIWGSGTPRREFLHVDDLASACIFLLEHYSDGLPINVGIGTDVTIQELAELIAEVVGFKGTFTFDRSKPDGTPRKCSDTTRLRQLGWAPAIDLRSGLRQTYDWFLSQKQHFQRHAYS
jgi:GDP-L-fucose synthase